jgi:flagellar biosynthesis component FlhA
MGSLEDRLKRLEGRVPPILRDREEEERQRLARAITRMILNEFARLKASREEGEADNLLERATRRVVEDQYEDLDPESRQYIADGWTETLHSWTRLDWMVSAGREGPPT